MKRITARAAIAFSIAMSAHAATALPKDVRAFVAKRDICEHFRGEFPDPPDPERVKEVNENLDKYCKGTDAKLSQLKRRYAKRRDVMRKLNAYEEAIE
jgi:Skp family chaperone for outer membrane proteins